MKDFQNQWREYNRLIKETDAMYNKAAQHFGLSYVSFWILYSLCDEDQPFTQSDLCQQWFISKQTINSAIASLIKSGYITLEAENGSRRKNICLTENGLSFCRKNILPFLEVDRASLSGLSLEERDMMLALMQKQLNYFKEGVKALWK